MIKKFLAVLMSVVMVMSTVPTVAMAADCTHENANYSQYTSDGNGKHTVTCPDCKEPQLPWLSCSGADADYDGTCDKCGYTYRVVTPPAPHEHNYIPHSNNDGTHTSSCTCGGEVTMNCSDTDGDGACDSCGYVKYVAPDVPHEHNYVPHSNNDGTHTSSCTCGGEVTMNCSDTDGDGACDSCGYVKYVAPDVPHEHNYVPHSNNDGTHTSSCTCGGEVTMNCSDTDGDGACDSCGYVKYVAPDAPHEHNYVSHPNHDGTHNSSCNCGLEKENIPCDDLNGDDACDSCGYFMPIVPDEPDVPEQPAQPQQPEEPVELPSYASVSTAGLDNVPKTGSSFVEWLYSLIFG